MPTPFTTYNLPLEQVLNSSLTSMSVYAAERDANGQLTRFRLAMLNTAAITTWAIPEDQLVGSQLSQLFTEADAFFLHQQFKAVIDNGQRCRFEMDYQWPSNGAMHRYAMLVTKLNDDGVLVCCSELTAGWQQERKQQADLLEQVMNTTPTGIVVHESIRDDAGEIIDFRMTRVNQVAADMLQSSIDRVQHRRISQYFPGLVDMPLFATYKQVAETGESARIDVRWGDYWYDFSVARLGDGIIAAAQDITDMRQYRQQLEQANYELKRSNENLQSFTYVASHDLQEPLRKITSFAAILNNQYAGQLAPDVTDIIRRINGAAERMRLLIQDLLTYSQVDAPLARLKKVNLTSLISDLTENELWAAIYQSKASVHVNDMPVLLADSFQMQQLFQNLLSNAIKFSRSAVAPVVTISSRLIARDAVPEVMLATVKREDNPEGSQYYEISIADNGIGFDEKHLDRIFQMFQRLHGRSQFTGSGVGLAICQKIVEKHGGAITATSQPGNGSTFRVYLPARK